MAAAFWRIVFPNLPSGGLGVEPAALSPSVRCTGVEMRGAIGSNNLIILDGGDGEAFGSSSSSQNTDGDYIHAFLPYSGTRKWESRTSLSGSGLRTFPQWVGYRFPASVEIEEITMTGVSGSFRGSMPHRMALEFSNSITGPWTTKYVWDVDPLPWREDGTDTRTFNGSNAESTTIFDALQVVTALNRTSQDVRTSALQTTTAIRQIANVVTSRLEVMSLIFVGDREGIIEAPIMFGINSNAVAFPPDITIDEGRKIILKRGPGIDLPGKPRRIAPRQFLKPLDESELAFANDTGRVFVGADPSKNLPQSRRLAYPYQNIEVITENSTEGFAGMHGARMREGDNYDYFYSVLVPVEGEAPATIICTMPRAAVVIAASIIGTL